MKLTLAFAFGFILALSVAAKSNQGWKEGYARGANETLDVTMWLNDQHKKKITWKEFNEEACRHLGIKRTDPWNRR